MLLSLAAGGRGTSFEVVTNQQPSHELQSQSADRQLQRPQHSMQQLSSRPPSDGHSSGAGFPAEIEPAMSGSGLEPQQSAGPGGLLPTSSQLLRDGVQPRTLNPDQQPQQSAGPGGLLPTSSQLLRSGTQPQQPRQQKQSLAAGSGPAEVPFAPQPPLPPPVTPRLRRRSMARAHRHGSAAGEPPDLSVEMQVRSQMGPSVIILQHASCRGLSCAGDSPRPALTTMQSSNPPTTL